MLGALAQDESHTDEALNYYRVLVQENPNS